jgi:hypothetical protein
MWFGVCCMQLNINGCLPLVIFIFFVCACQLAVLCLFVSSNQNNQNKGRWTHGLLFPMVIIVLSCSDLQAPLSYSGVRCIGL